MAKFNFKFIVLSLLVALLLAFSQLASGQFFTKTAKSIPRMGRRSTVQAQDPYKRLLVDTLIDQYGPSYVERLKLKALQLNDIGGPGLGNEIELQNEQPIDFYGATNDLD